MSATKITELPSITSIKLDDTVIITQGKADQAITYQATVAQLLSLAAPIPVMDSASYDAVKQTLNIKGMGFLPHSLVTIDNVPQLITDYQMLDDLASINIRIQDGLAKGSYTVAVSNLVNKVEARLEVKE